MSNGTMWFLGQGPRPVAVAAIASLLVLFAYSVRLTFRRRLSRNPQAAFLCLIVIVMLADSAGRNWLSADRWERLAGVPGGPWRAAPSLGLMVSALVMAAVAAAFIIVLIELGEPPAACMVGLTAVPALLATAFEAMYLRIGEMRWLVFGQISVSVAALGVVCFVLIGALWSLGVVRPLRLNEHSVFRALENRIGEEDREDAKWDELSRMSAKATAAADARTASGEGSTRTLIRRPAPAHAATGQTD